MMLSFKRILKSRPFLISLHILGWACFLFFPFFIYRIQIMHTGFFLKELVDNLFLIGIFYLNIYVLIPRYFNRSKIVTYLCSIALLIIFITAQQAALNFYFFKHLGPRPEMMAVRLGQKSNTVSVTSDSFPPFHHRRMFFSARASMGEPAFVTRGEVHDTAGGAVTVAAPGFLPMHPPRIFEEGPTLWEYLFFPEVLRRSGFFALLMLFMSGFIKIALEWFKSEKQREELKVEKLNAELKFLKSQINPHFLFNCLNTIYSLAHKQSTQTEHAILKLSTIMRYMIYESNEAKVLLSQELKYLHDYIEIQRLRLPKDINIRYQLNGDADGLQIEPMLLVPFVENAFKHGISYTEESFIDIDVTTINDMIRLIVKNSHFKERVAERGGIGLDNVLKRLALLYENRHEINISETENQFIVDLKIVLNK
ncbi:histidine kinase [Chitinophaga polysaccharea]|uniref:sensor histidine kinase n=1 Tax=Chitinophaga TaxID=79328 RepID=UPI00145500FA|nr:MULTISPECIES: histidine kinase [Chitinophaga]NLR61160.1 histidine kinase [Chitinophaga polysaccharea]NLU94998.1 histidine kinase [Chitinophaga sp. Ak27]